MREPGLRLSGTLAGLGKPKAISAVISSDRDVVVLMLEGFCIESVKQLARNLLELLLWSALVVLGKD